MLPRWPARLRAREMTMASIAAAVRSAGLAIVGAFHPGPEDMAPEGIDTLLLLGPADGTMWAAFRASRESSDGDPHPLDRWSRRVIDGLALRLGAEAFYPFGGPPWHPFQRWAAAGEGAISSPVSMQATHRRGLFASYRGALGFQERLALEASPTPDPCLECPAPCLAACPVNAFANGRYDVPSCLAHVTSAKGAMCRAGCLVRIACPAGADMALPVEQLAFHMAAFLRAQGADV